MTPIELLSAMSEFEVLRREPIAIHFVTSRASIPEGIPEFGVTAEGTPKSMLCAMWGDALLGAGPFYTVKSHHICGGGTIAAGFGSTMPIEKAAKFMVGEKLVFGTQEGLENALAGTLPFRDDEFEAMIISPLRAVAIDMWTPDVVILIMTPAQGQRFLRAYGFDSGEITTGIAGTSTCEMLTSYVMHTGKPTFTLGDLGGNTGMMIADDEVIVAFPYQLFHIAVTNLGRICRRSTMPLNLFHHETPKS